MLAFNTTGDLFEGFGAGAIKGAAGVEYRYEKGSNIGSQDGAPDYVRNDYLIQYGESFAGKVKVTKCYVEVNVPVLKDVSWPSAWSSTWRPRFSRYDNNGTLGPGAGISNSHDLPTWKVSGFWDPVDWLRVRASQSRDSRAANFRELYYGQIIQAGGAFGYCTPAGAPAGAIPDPCTWSLEGNVDVEAGKVGYDDRRPGVHAADCCRASSLRWTTSTSRSTTPSSRRTLPACGRAARSRICQEFCDLLVADPGALPTPGTNGNYTYNPANGQGIKTLRATSFNGSLYDYAGLDFTGSYLLNMNSAGQLNFRLLATYMDKQMFSPVPGQAPVNIVGQTGTANSFLNDNNPRAQVQCAVVDHVHQESVLNDAHCALHRRGQAELPGRGSERWRQVHHCTCQLCAL